MKAEILDEEDYETLEEEKELNTKFLLFPMGEKDFALKIRYVTEIVSILPITELPNMPNYLLGIVNLRGRGIPVIDARIRFGMSSSEYNDKTVIIVLNLNETFYGLIVDGVREVVTIPEDSIEPALDFQTDFGSRFVEGLAKVGDKVKILLDIQKLIAF